MALVGAVTVIAALLADLGVGKVLFHRQQISYEVLSSLYWMNILSSIVLMAILWLLAGMLADTLNEPVLVAVLKACSLIFPLSALGHIFRVLAEKQMAFAVLARNELLAVLAGFCVAVIVAYADGGVFSLVSGLLANTLILTLLSCLYLPTHFKPHVRLRMVDVKPFIRLGGFSMGESIANNLRMQTDILIGGALLGSAGLGVYSVPRDLCLRVGMLINPIITRVSLPVMARSGASQPALRNTYLDTLRMTASVNAPLYYALTLYSGEIIGLLFGEKWLDSSRVLQILALWGLLRSIGNLVGSLVYAVGQVRRAFWWNVALFFCVPPFLLLGAYIDGAEGVAWAMFACQAATFIAAWFWMVRPLCGAGLWEYTAQPGLPILLALIASVAAYVGTYWINTDLLRLVFGLGIGAASYLALSWRFNYRWWRKMRELISPLIKGGSSELRAS